MKNHFSFLFVTTVLLFSCDSDSSDLIDIINKDLEQLEISFISASGSSDLMPQVPPDPIGISATYKFHNISNETIVLPDSFLANVYNSKNDSLLGVISVYPNPDINIDSNETEEIVFYKTLTNQRAFEPPCKDSIYIKIFLIDNDSNELELTTPNFYYVCYY